MPVVTAEVGWSPSKIEAMHNDKKQRRKVYSFFVQGPLWQIEPM